MSNFEPILSAEEYQSEAKEKLIEAAVVWYAESQKEADPSIPFYTKMVKAEINLMDAIESYINRK